MPCASAEKWYFDTYAPRLSFDVMNSWSIRQQVEAFDELDVIAATTADSVMRGACLGVLTSRPDIAVLSKLGCKEDGEEFLALFEDEYVGERPTVTISEEPRVEACGACDAAYERLQRFVGRSPMTWAAPANITNLDTACVICHGDADHIGTGLLLGSDLVFTAHHMVTLR